MANPDARKQTVRFAEFELDVSAGELNKNGVRNRLQGQPFQVLQLLLESPGRVITREELRNKLWPADTYIDFDHGLNKAISKIREALEDSAEKPRYVETLPRRGYRFIAPVNRSSEPQLGRGQPGDSVAVFPLANSDPDADYLASGIPESILHSLSPLPNLSVITGRFRAPAVGQERDAEMIGRKFKARAALLGRLLQRRTKLRLQVDLVDTTTGKALWADEYEREFSEFFLVQENIVKEVSQRLRLDLNGRANCLAKRYTDNAEAYRLYLRGRHSCELRSMEGFRKGAAHFKDAIQLDPQYALAYAGLATALYLPGYYGSPRPEESFSRARAAAEKALELDDNLAEAHEALASLSTFEWRWTTAEQEYRRSLDLNPNFSLSRYRYAMCLAETGRFQEAIAESVEAQALDPLSGPTNACLAWTLWAAGQYDKALEQSFIATELDPNSLFSRIAAGVCYDQSGMYKESIAEFEEGVKRNGGSMFLGFQGHAFARSGDRTSAWNNVQRMKELSKTHYVTPAHLALTFAGLGENDLVIQALEEAYTNRDSFLVFTKLLPQYESLRSDPRFQDLLHRMNFPL